MKPLFNAEQVRLIEAQCLASVAPGELIRRAGLSLAREAERMSWPMKAPVRVHALCGPGNNGADARLAAQALSARGFVTRCWSLEELLTAGSSAQALNMFTAEFDEHCLLIDGLFGIGLSRPIEGALATVIEALNTRPCRVLAVDIPSGLDASTGQVQGIALRSDRCLTMLTGKTGLHTGQAAAFAPGVLVDELGCEAVLYGTSGVMRALEASGQATYLLSAADLPSLLPRRSAVSHKGTQGSVLVIGGDSSMKGAAVLAAQGAQAGGSGKVFVHFLDGQDKELETMAMQHPSLLAFKRPPDWHAALTQFDAVLIGCGLGQSKAALAVLTDILKAGKASLKPLVLDADALNLIASTPQLQQLLALSTGSDSGSDAGTFPAAANPGPDASSGALADPDRPWLPWVMTPHPLEAARLLSRTTATIQSDRLTCARDICLRYGMSLILKGPGSVIAGPQALGDNASNTLPSVRLAVAPPGSPALAVGGSGDTLAGLVLSLLGQGLAAFDAASLAASVHSLAASRWSDTHPRAQGMRAEDLPSLIVDWMNLEH